MTTTGPVDTPESVADSISRQAGRGLRWSLIGTIVTKVGSFAMSLVLARLLAPSDFGTFAIALAATSFLMHIKDGGLIAATVQWRGKLEEVAPTATTLTAGFGIVVYGVMWLSAPYFAELAGDRSATPVVRLLTLIVLIDGLTSVRSAALMRTFQQNKLIVANSAGLVANAAIAISLAVDGAGAFSFAYGQVAGAAVTGLLVLAFVRLPLRLGLDSRIARQLLRYGVPLAASLGVEAIVMNAQFLIVGSIAGPTALGFFLLAFNVASWAQTVLGTAIRYVSVAGFSRLSEQDHETLSDGVRRSMPLLVTVVAPISALTTVLATPVVLLLYGGQWAASAPVLEFLAMLTLARMITGLAMDALMGAGATPSTLWVNGGWALALIPALWVATHVDGIRGAAIAHAAIGLFVAVPLAALMLHRARVDVRSVGHAIVRPIVAAVFSSAVAWIVARYVGPNPLVQLLVGGCVGVLLYVPAAVPLDRLRQGVAMLRREPAVAAE